MTHKKIALLLIHSKISRWFSIEVKFDLENNLFRDTHNIEIQKNFKYTDNSINI